jgi:hypothetical protein
MIDAFDIIAFVVIAGIIVVAVIVVVWLGQLPGRIAKKRGHPQAAAITAASWLGLATGGVLWLIAFIWAFLKPISSIIQETSKVSKTSEVNQDATSNEVSPWSPA